MFAETVQGHKVVVDILPFLKRRGVQLMVSIKHDGAKT